MESDTRVHRSGIMLLEVMISILLVSVCSAVCLQVFARAQHTSRQAQLLTEAVNACASAAEVLRGTDSPESAFLLLQQENSQNENGTLTLPQKNGCVLKISMQKTKPAGARISYLDETGSEVYALELIQYGPEVIS